MEQKAEEEMEEEQKNVMKMNFLNTKERKKKQLTRKQNLIQDILGHIYDSKFDFKKIMFEIQHKPQVKAQVQQAQQKRFASLSKKEWKEINSQHKADKVKENSQKQRAFTLDTPLVDKAYKKDQKFKQEMQQINFLIKSAQKRTLKVPGVKEQRAYFKRKLLNEDPLREKVDITLGVERPDFRQIKIQLYGPQYMYKTMVSSKKALGQKSITVRQRFDKQILPSITEQLDQMDDQKKIQQLDPQQKFQLIQKRINRQQQEYLEKQKVTIKENKKQTLSQQLKGNQNSQILGLTDFKKKMKDKSWQTETLNSQELLQARTQKNKIQQNNQNQKSLLFDSNDQILESKIIENENVQEESDSNNSESVLSPTLSVNLSRADKSGNFSLLESLSKVSKDILSEEQKQQIQRSASTPKLGVSQKSIQVRESIIKNPFTKVRSVQIMQPKIIDRKSQMAIQKPQPTDSIFLTHALTSESRAKEILQDTNEKSKKLGNLHQILEEDEEDGIQNMKKSELLKNAKDFRDVFENIMSKQKFKIKQKSKMREYQDRQKVNYKLAMIQNETKSIFKETKKHFQQCEEYKRLCKLLNRKIGPKEPPLDFEDVLNYLPLIRNNSSEEKMFRNRFKKLSSVLSLEQLEEIDQKKFNQRLDIVRNQVIERCQELNDVQKEFYKYILKYTYVSKDDQLRQDFVKAMMASIEQKENLNRFYNQVLHQSQMMLKESDQKEIITAFMIYFDEMFKNFDKKLIGRKDDLNIMLMALISENRDNITVQVNDKLFAKNRLMKNMRNLMDFDGKKKERREAIVD